MTGTYRHNHYNVLSFFLVKTKKYIIKLACLITKYVKNIDTPELRKILRSL